MALNVSVTNNAPVGGVYLTPAWVGFHNGSFDSYDGGTPSSAGLQQLAEDGNTSGLSAEFATANLDKDQSAAIHQVESDS